MIAAIRRWLATRADLNAAIALFALVLIGAMWVVVEQEAEHDEVIAMAAR